MFWLQWFVAKHRFPARHLNTDLATFLGVSVAMIILGCIYAFGLPWVVAKCPSRIVLYDCYLQRCRGQCVLLYFKNVASFSLNVGAEFSTLVLKLRSGRESFIGVPNDMPMEEIRLFLCERIPIEA
jgi:hypothetical protein